MLEIINNRIAELYALQENQNYTDADGASIEKEIDQLIQLLGELNNNNN